MSDDHRHDDLHERLDQLDRRLAALEADLAASRNGGAGQKYFESGDIHPELDDQTIAP